MQQITLNFDADQLAGYATGREFVAYRAHQQKKFEPDLGKYRRLLQKEVAANMDYGPSQLTRKLAQGENDNMRFTLDDFEKFIESTGDKSPVMYYVVKYLIEEDDDESIEELERRLAAKKAAKSKRK